MGQIQWAPARPHPRSFPITSKGRVFNSCFRSAMLHASETWAPTLPDLHRLQRNDQAMIRWMCGVTTKDQVSWHDLLKRMQLDGLARYSAPADLDGTTMKMVGWRTSWNLIPQEVVAVAAVRKTWTEMSDMSGLVLGLTKTHPSDRKAWSIRLRSAVRLDPPLYQGPIQSSIN